MSLSTRRDRVVGALARLTLPAELADSAVPVTLASEFVLTVLERRPEPLIERLLDPDEFASPSFEFESTTSEATVMSALRERRQLEMARIAWRDLAGWSDLERTMRELSQLADSMITAALAQAERSLATRYGYPRTASGRQAGLLVLAMGKLGGRELNFSSDIDLIFLYPDDVQLDGDQRIEAEVYFRRLAQLLIRLLNEKTAEGFVFRVDARLRPFGQSGPLAISLSALESYLLHQGRDWERYAYMKARLVTGHDYERDVFDELLTPFVYRRYLDYGIFESLRQMKRMIAAEVAQKEKQDNIKLGAGGIREIEFIAQALQLVRGGQEPRLRSRYLLDALPLLAGILPDQSIEKLTTAYRFLRALENRLQALDDRQTHDLPADDEHRARLALAMGAEDWPALAAETGLRRADVQKEFAKLAWETGDADEFAYAIAAWESGDVETLVADSCLAGDETVAEALGQLRSSRLYERMDEPSRQRLARVIARLLPHLADEPTPGDALVRVLPVLQSICRRSAYLAMLNENPVALDRLVTIAGSSPLLARQMADYPLLLDELLDARLFDEPPTRDELAAMLQNSLDRLDPDDAEAHLDAIRQFQRAALFQIAVADRLGGLPLMKVSDRLTDTAELVIATALEIAWREQTSKYGEPTHGDASTRERSAFAVIAYGKLGGLELGYGSDLDLVFLHDSSGPVQHTTGPTEVDNQRFFTRLVQRLIHLLTIQTSSGRLYEIDTRLRPSGAAGLMVSSLSNFQKYQREQAWTWEHQALLRSRSVAGDERLCAQFEHERVCVLTQHVALDTLAADVSKMRTRMFKELATGTRDAFDLKQDRGGLADIEFLIDYLVLVNARAHPALVRYPDNVRQLEAIAEAGLAPADDCADLKEAYLRLRADIHRLSLNDAGRLVPTEPYQALRQRVVALWNRTFGEDIVIE